MAHIEVTGTRSEVNGQCILRGRWTLEGKRKSRTTYTTDKLAATLIADVDQFIERLKEDKWRKQNPSEWGSLALAPIQVMLENWSCNSKKINMNSHLKHRTPMTNGALRNG